MSTTQHRKKRGAVTGSIGIALTAFVGVGIFAMTGGSASAVDVQELDAEKDSALIEATVKQCFGEPLESGPPTCSWSDIKVSNPRDAKATVVGDQNNAHKFINCGQGVVRENITFSRTKGHTVKVSGKLELGSKVEEVFAGFEAAGKFRGGVAWVKARTHSGTEQLEVPPGETGWITHTAKEIEGSGTLTALYQSEGAEPVSLVIKGMTLVAPHASDGGATATHTRKHTAEDAAECASAPAPIGTEEKLTVRDGSDLPDVG